MVGSGIEPAVIDVASATGGLLLLGVGLRLLEIRKIRVVNFLPALVLAPLFFLIARQAGAVLAQ